MSAYGAVVGRFQTHELTEGHKALLDHVAGRHMNLIVFIGCKDSPPTAKNPLSFELRRQMIHEYNPFAIVRKVWDHPSNETWSKNLDKEIEKITLGANCELYVGRNSFKPFYSGKYKVNVVEFGIDSSATEQRLEVKEFQGTGLTPEEKRMYRAGVVHAMQNIWDRTYITVDMALLHVDHLGTSICLIKKPGETHWALPGGFKNLGETLAQAAAREMKEETNLEADTEWMLIQDFQISDWRIRYEQGVDHLTFLMSASVKDRKTPIASDDVEYAEWWPLFKLDDYVVLDPAHRAIIEKVKQDLDLVGVMK